ncbi:MAG TPA: hypothetical protein V6C78_01105 [Crinalium sp.]|jgi:hypothetical protein
MQASIPVLPHRQPLRKTLIHRLLPARKVDVKPEAIAPLKNEPPSSELMELEILMRPA